MIVADLSISVVMCCHTEKRWPTIEHGIRATQEQLRTDDSLVLVVDHCRALYERARTSFPRVTVVENRERSGLSGARNTGIEQSTSTVIAFLDDDAIPDPRWLSGIRAAFVDDSVMMVGGEVAPSWPTNSGRPPNWFPPEFGWVVGCDYLGMPATGRPIRNPIGANMAIRRSCLADVGRFNTDLGRNGSALAGCEETDMGIRVHGTSSPGAVVRISGARVSHHVSADRCSRRYFVRRCFDEGRSKFELSRLVGTERALASERRYLLVALPAGIVRNACEVSRGDVDGLQRAAWTAIGVAATASGWIVARISKTHAATARSRRRRRSTPEVFESIPRITVDLAELPEDFVFGAVGARDCSYFVTVQGSPLGVLHSAHESGSDLHGHAQFLNAVTAEFGSPLREHLELVFPSRKIDLESASALSHELSMLREHAVNPRLTVPPPIPVTVVVCTLGREPRLKNTLRSILAQSHASLRVIVVDNDPDSGKVDELLSGCSDPRLSVVRERRRGVSAARNAGIRSATDEIILFTDDDAEPDPHWVERVTGVFCTDTAGTIACVTGLVLPAAIDSRSHQWFEESTGFEKGFQTMAWPHRDSSADPLSRDGRRGPVYPYTGSEFGSGNNMAFRRTWLLENGGFDELLGTGTPAKGGEDLDIFRRVVLSGRSLIYFPAAVVYHHHRDSYRELRRQMYAYGVGMCCNLLRHAVRGPAELAHVVQGIPRGIAELSDPRSEKNNGKSQTYPVSLTVIELAGYALGPAHFIRSYIGFVLDRRRLPNGALRLSPAEDSRADRTQEMVIGR
ncbi:glycosyltransferase [Rhodococcus erythropolis]|uniref:glycosyltransferase n=1 Tax=Rhodococcus erythropolis TaxID=1833 RepID=UPI0008AB13F9|nr:glycosyltransferase family 2 protein [Rhodococcus erythropolis]OFV73533.1 putative glycosyl transferase [Rhodococcus erythropolis]